MYPTPKKILKRSQQRSKFDAPRARSAHNNSPHRAEQCPRDLGTAAPRAQISSLPAGRQDAQASNTYVYPTEKNESLTPTQHIRCTARTQCAQQLTAPYRAMSARFGDRRPPRAKFVSASGPVPARACTATTLHAHAAWPSTHPPITSAHIKRITASPETLFLMRRTQRRRG